MKKQTIGASLTSTALLMMSLSGSLYSNDSLASEYCSSAKLYATNIRRSCNQFGANGMQALYQRSEFISGIRSLDQSSSKKRSHEEALSSKEAS